MTPNGSRVPSGGSVEERELLALGERIAATPHPSASPALRAQLRASLMSAPVQFAVAPRRWGWSALRPILAAAVILVVALGGAGYAAASSLAGDPAFALKQAAEEVELASAPNEAARLRTLVAHSDRRLAELQKAIVTRPASANAASQAYLSAVKHVDDALKRVLSQPSTDARDDAAREATEASESHLDMLRELEQRLPEAAQPGIQRAIEVQTDVHRRSDELPPARRTPAPPKPTASPSRR